MHKEKLVQIQLLLCLLVQEEWYLPNNQMLLVCLVV